MASAEEQAKAVADKCDAELTFIFSEAGLSIETQFKITEAGFTTMRRFANLEDSRSAIRDCIKDTFGIDQTTNAAARLQVAMIVDAWEVARETTTRDIKMRAEAKVTNQSRPINKQEKVAMRRVVEQAHGKLPEDEGSRLHIPCRKVGRGRTKRPPGSPSRRDPLSRRQHGLRYVSGDGRQGIVPGRQTEGESRHSNLP